MDVKEYVEKRQAEIQQAIYKLQVQFAELENLRTKFVEDEPEKKAPKSKD